ncbi:Flp pilus assembly protein TadG [Nocardioides daedukensis]|uniref:Flp pilus assembly protein TadG n=1 Tax=Nocardioides daedukensis TaxID=634462 RepID=A0A7Y9S279_9ACTN|nr:Flp pilus assembly protein TadG [Nocardioides daedukensis]
MYDVVVAAKRRIGRRKERNESGASAVEFALVFPILALMLFGIISYGYMFTIRQTMTQAAAEGARAGAVAASDPQAKAADGVAAALAGTSLRCGTNGLVCDYDDACTTSTGAECVKVTLRLDYNVFDPFEIPLVPMPDSLEFTSQAEVN